jgi:hypothetical protein
MGESILRKSIHLVVALAGVSLLASAAVAGNGGKGNGGGLGGGSSSGSSTLIPAVSCGTGDVTGPGFTVISCSGDYEGNLLNGGKNAAELPDALTQSLYGSSDPTGAYLPVTFSFDKNSKVLTLGTPLKTGISLLGIHWGAGNGVSGPGVESTAIYVLDAAQGVNTLHLKYSSYSNAQLFVTGVPLHVAAAPEPGTWATMIAGFGMTGFVMRRRKRAAAKLA